MFGIKFAPDLAASSTAAIESYHALCSRRARSARKRSI